MEFAKPPVYEVSAEVQVTPHDDSPPFDDDIVKAFSSEILENAKKTRRFCLLVTLANAAPPNNSLGR